MNRAVKLVSIFLIFFLLPSGLYSRRKQIPLNKLTPEMLKLPKRIHIYFFNQPVSKKITLIFHRKSLTVKIDYHQPPSIINKLLRKLADIDKNNKINGFESDSIYDYFHDEMTKNLTLQINDTDLKCETIKNNIPDIYGPVDNREFIYQETMRCEIKNIIRFRKKNTLFISDYVKLPAHQEKFESPVEIKIIFPEGWKIKGRKSRFFKGKVDQNSTILLTFVPG